VGSGARGGRRRLAADDRARPAAGGLRALGIEYRVADAATLSKIGSFDRVSAAYLLHYAESRERLLQMMRTIYDNLAPGERFVASIANPLRPPQPLIDQRKYGFSSRLLDDTLHEGARLRGTLSGGSASSRSTAERGPLTRPRLVRRRPASPAAGWDREHDRERDRKHWGA
jgi:SAM-dependent methyltransferase